MATDSINIVDPYDSYEPYVQEDASGVAGDELLNSVAALQVGFGSQVLRIDRQGIWLGAETFGAAPFSVAMDGSITATSLDLSSYLQIGEALGDIGAGNITGTYIANGAITTAKLTATAIDGMTVTGALIRTSSSGSRVEIDDVTDSVIVYDTGNVKRMQLDNDELTFYNASGTLLGTMWAATTNMFIRGADNMEIQATDVLDLIGEGSSITLTASSINFSQDIQMYSNDILGCGDIILDSGNLKDISNIDRLEGYAGFIDLGYSSYFTLDNDWVPQTTNTYDLGRSTTIWQDAYIDEVHYNTLTAMSDVRLKENVVDLNLGLESIKSLKPVSFNYKEQDVKFTEDRKNKEKFREIMKKRKKKFLRNKKARAEKLHYGFIAQDVQAILPNLVSKNKDDDMLNLNQTELIPVLVRAVQELAAEVEALKN